MKRFVRNTRGQFAIIAVLLIAIMIVSTGALMQRATTYYRAEPWNEYLGLIGNLELSVQRTLELSLADNTQTLDNSILKNNLENWQIDLPRIYSGREIAIENTLANGPSSISGVGFNYSLGLARHWYSLTSFSAANVTTRANISSIGLTGYEFVSTAFLKVTLLDVYWSTTSGDVNAYLTVEKENYETVTDLDTSCFSLVVDGQTKNFVASQSYNESYTNFVYRIYSHSASAQKPSFVSVSVVDTRNIKVVATEGGTTLKMYNPTDDAWVESKNPDTNFGMQGVIHVRRDPGIPGNVRRTYMKYNLSEVPANATIFSARLWAYCKTSSPDVDIPIWIYAAASDDWSESTLTWNNAPPPDIFVTSTMIDGEGKWYSWDITWFFVQEYTGDKLISLVIRMPYENSTEAYHRDFYSAESNVNKPYIEVDYAQGPQAAFTFSPPNPFVQQPVSFNASASQDADGTISEYRWDFGDGTPPLTTSNPMATHVYTTQGNFTAVLTIVDIQGVTSTTTRLVNVRPSPVASSLTYTAGAAQTLAAGTISSNISVQRRDQYGNPFTNGSTVVTLSANATSGSFYSDSNATIQITSVTISTGESSAMFYYKDNAAGTPILEASSTNMTSATTQFTIT